ncbi:MAG: HEPN domain-containing protein [Candidatus Methylomirabilales bacterium]
MDEGTRAVLQAHLEKARQKHEAAVALLKAGFFEDAVSRAYYAAFHAAQAALLTEGQQADTHKGLSTLFGLFFVKTGRIEKRFGRYLANLKDDRETSDYEALAWVDEQVAAKAVQEARELCQAVEEYLSKIGILRGGP